MEAGPTITERGGMFHLMLRSCTAGILAHILDPEVPFVWVRRHMPHRYAQWRKTQACLSERGVLQDVEVRSMEYDLLAPTARFLELLPEFESHGMVLYQMRRRVPDTLTLDGVADEAVDRVLLQNGLHLRFYLPHAVECASVSSPDRPFLERVSERPEVRPFVM
ncbi:MAG: hypothetical protein ACO1TE_05870 [Prosthecobacter sp.]